MGLQGISTLIPFALGICLIALIAKVKLESVKQLVQESQTKQQHSTKKLTQANRKLRQEILLEAKRAMCPIKAGPNYIIVKTCTSKVQITLGMVKDALHKHFLSSNAPNASEIATLIH